MENFQPLALNLANMLLRACGWLLAVASGQTTPEVAVPFLMKIAQRINGMMPEPPVDHDDQGGAA